MLSWLSKQVITRIMARTRAGDIEPTLRLDAEDVRFVFPGDNSWSGEYHGKAELRPWLERLVRAGIKTFPDEVVAAGPPWRTTVCIRGHDHAYGPDGKQVYENRFVIWGKLRWGKLYDYEVYEDTQKAKAFDGWLAANEQPQVTSAVA
jgi:ketosteroid isomerase-like protein